MTLIEANEFPFVEEMPKRAKSRFTMLWEHFTEMRAVVKEKGLLVPVKLAADIAGVSQQRISQLMEAGSLERVEFHGHPFITEASFIVWAKSERKTGRPLKLPETLSDKWRVGHGKPKKEK